MPHAGGSRSSHRYGSSDRCQHQPPPRRVAARISARLEERDDYGVVLLLILGTIVMISVGFGSVGEFLSVCLSGFTLLFVLHTSDARQRTFRLSAVIVAVAVAAAAVGFLSGEQEESVAAGLIGLLLAFAAPVMILLRIFHSPRITVRLVLGALAIYLLLGLTYAYLYPVIGVLTAAGRRPCRRGGKATAGRARPGGFRSSVAARRRGRQPG